MRNKVIYILYILYDTRVYVHVANVSHDSLLDVGPCVCVRGGGGVNRVSYIRTQHVDSGT